MSEVEKAARWLASRIGDPDEMKPRADGRGETPLWQAFTPQAEALIAWFGQAGFAPI